MEKHGQLFQQVKFHIESKNFPAALRQLRQELDANPDDPRVLFWLGICLAEINEFAEAEQHLKHASGLDPYNKEIGEALQTIQQMRSGEEIERPMTSHYFDLGEPVEYKKKECPNCHKRVGVESWQCGYCKHVFWKRVLVQLGIFFVVAGLVLGTVRTWFSGFMGYGFQPAAVVNKAGEDGKRVQITDTEWNAIGLGLTQHRGTGYDGSLKGTMKNTGDRTIEKANITVFFQDDGDDITFVWYDVFNWKPDQEIKFEFPGILPPYRPTYCEMRIESVKLAETEPAEDVRPEFYVPNSNHFRSYRFSAGDVTLAEKMYGAYKAAAPWTFKQFVYAYLEIIPAFLFNYICVLLSVILVNICDPEKAWNEELQLDIIGSAFVVMGFIVLNVIWNLIGWIVMILGILGALISMGFFFAKLYLFYLFFKRSAGFTFLMIIFYICLVMTGMGLYYNIAGTPEKPGVSMPGQYGIMQPQDMQQTNK